SCEAGCGYNTTPITKPDPNSTTISADTIVGSHVIAMSTMNTASEHPTTKASHGTRTTRTDSGAFCRTTTASPSKPLGMSTAVGSIPYENHLSIAARFVPEGE